MWQFDRGSQVREEAGSLQTPREPVDNFGRLRELVRSSEKIVVISGAGISVSTSFDRSLYSSSEEITSFHSTYASIVELIKPDTGYITGFVTISHIYSKVPIRYTIKGPHPDDKEILETAEHDLRLCPELVLIVGTKLAIPGARSIAADFYHAVRSVSGASFWINKEVRSQWGLDCSSGI
ncbi:hypothetical protein NA56DRAFT_725729 [Hyaloscypha hepaticicola]|uniref:DHS-like NAD/FAD-binding domain-containing protein n=1 Tax=Hyaloscypha hepaticicola TaxID=2082293 RepID=A0A2J6QL20_9HELO|nr:hypothetical protein NA56DRAFT_725729 [Hyaloscypha hepaticicola]